MYFSIQQFSVLKTKNLLVDFLPAWIFLSCQSVKLPLTLFMFSKTIWEIRFIKTKSEDNNAFLHPVCLCPEACEFIQAYKF